MCRQVLEWSGEVFVDVAWAGPEGEAVEDVDDLAIGGEFGIKGAPSVGRKGREAGYNQRETLYHWTRNLQGKKYGLVPIIRPRGTIRYPTWRPGASRCGVSPFFFG